MVKQRSRLNPADLEIFKSLFHSVAEEMGAALRRSAFSPNIKERRDYSCAVFDRHCRAIAMGDHMPVHLGSMPMSVAAAVEALHPGRGDIVVLNDPYAGGTHLPDITLVMAVIASAGDRALFCVANRAHHADVGGARPASMGLSEEIYQEGLRIPPVFLVRNGDVQRDVMSLLLANVRTPEEREGDLAAQLAACRLGERRLQELVAKFGPGRIEFACDELHSYADRLMRSALRRIPDGTYEAEDLMDDDGYGRRPVRFRVQIRIEGERAVIDFAGTDRACRGSINAVMAITVSAVFYAFRCLLGEDVPACAGLMTPIEVLAPDGSVVNARAPHAVAAGNVETSQRIVDVLFKALARALPAVIPAASSGSMSNVSWGGVDPKKSRPFAYYETIAGGMGARPCSDGLDAVHTHMTNSLNTPIEALESTYPVRVRRYAVRRGSGGAGKFRGGDGLVREIEFLSSVRGSVLSDRRKTRPYGLAGGEPGRPGRNLLHRAGAHRVPSATVELPSKVEFEAPSGSVLEIQTPGGGGWGKRRG